MEHYLEVVRAEGPQIMRLLETTGTTISVSRFRIDWRHNHNLDLGLLTTVPYR